MKTVSCLNDLRPYGIEVLTGEACGLYLRMLCDFTARGQRLICKAYGLAAVATFKDSWNPGSKEDPHVGSIMLSHDDYVTLGIFALLDNGCRSVYRFSPGGDLCEQNRVLAQALRSVKARLSLVGEAEEPTFVNAEERVLPDWREQIEEIEQALAAYKQRAIVNDYTLYGVESRDDNDYLVEYLERARKDGWGWRSYGYHGTAGDRNVHEMSGRTT